MVNNTGGNYSEINGSHAVLRIESETVTFNREPPPPYSERDIPSVTTITEPPVIPQTIFVQRPLKTGPMLYNCPVCRTAIVTRVEYVTTRKTHMIAGFLCGFTFWCMLCCLAAIPYLTTAFKTTVHYCPNCKTCLGTHSKV